MPKRPKSDPEGRAFEEQLSAQMAKLGAKAGKAIGDLSDKQRREIALKAAKARWSRKK